MGLFLEELGLEALEEPGNSGRYSFYTGSPSYGRNIIFNEPEEAVLVLKDENDHARLAEFIRGNGTITVTGRPNFMTSYNLDREPNARLCWYLFARPGEDKGIFFIRGERRPEGFLGRFFSRGNFLIIIISAIILIVIGFWTVIPVFGAVRGTGEKEGKVLAERFLAEGHFLNRFNSLDIYRSVYYREIRRRIIKKEHFEDDEIIRQAAYFWAKGPEGIAAVTKAAEGGSQNKRDFFRSIKILKTILERL